MNKSKPLVKRSPSRTLQRAKRAGLDIHIPQPHLTITEQEATDEA